MAFPLFVLGILLREKFTCILAVFSEMRWLVVLGAIFVCRKSHNLGRLAVTFLYVRVVLRDNNNL